MQDTNWDDYDSEYLSFVLGEARTLHEETLTSFRDSINRSFTVVLIFGGAISFCLNKVIQYTSLKDIAPYFVGILGLTVSVFIIWDNLMPNKMDLCGTKPEKLLNDYFGHPSFAKDRKKEMTKVRLEDINKAIGSNIIQIETRTRRFKNASLAFLVTLGLCLVTIWLMS